MVLYADIKPPLVALLHMQDYRDSEIGPDPNFECFCSVQLHLATAFNKLLSWNTSDNGL
jgi:hypothetical protein